MHNNKKVDMSDKTIEWIATVILIVGTGFNSLGYYPLGPILLCSGGVVWLIVALRWKEPALIVTNAVMLLTGVLGLLYHYIG
jgi:hypothetical protein